MNLKNLLNDDRKRGILYFVLAAIAILLLKLSQSTEDADGRGLLITSFIFLFAMLMIFLWTNRKNRWLMAGATLLYVWVAWYWL